MDMGGEVALAVSKVKILLFLKKKKQKDFYSMVARAPSLGA